MSKSPKIETNDTPVVEKPVKAWSLPYKVKCSVSGAVKAVRHEVLLKRLDNPKYHGTLRERFEQHMKDYKCADVRRAERNALKEAAAKAKAEAAANAPKGVQKQAAK